MIMINACHENVVHNFAGGEAELHGEKAKVAGKKSHTAVSALERDDSAMEEAWVCPAPSHVL